VLDKFGISATKDLDLLFQKFDLNSLIRNIPIRKNLVYYLKSKYSYFRYRDTVTLLPITKCDYSDDTTIAFIEDFSLL
jgi:hypothetical protein